MFENNPVHAANGPWQSWQSRTLEGEVLHHIPVEMHVWLDPAPSSTVNLADSASAQPGIEEDRPCWCFRRHPSRWLQTPAVEEVGRAMG